MTQDEREQQESSGSNHPQPTREDVPVSRSVEPRQGVSGTEDERRQAPPSGHTAARGTAAHPSGRVGGLRTGVYNAEHWLAWLFEAGAIALGVIGALTSFGVINVRDTIAGGTPAVASGNFQDGALFLLPAIGAALLAMTLHNTEHHRSARSLEQPVLWSLEHWLAYLGVVATIVFGVLSIVVGFNVFDSGNSWRDGVTWGTLSVLSGVLTFTLHHVEHHAFVFGAEDAEISRVIESRMGTTGATSTGTGTAPESALTSRQ